MTGNSFPKMSGIYLLKDGSMLVCGIDYEPTGPGGLSSKVVTRMSPEAAPLVLGMVAIRTLEATRRIDARNWEAKDVLPGLLAMAGVKSNRALESSAKYVHLFWKEAEIRVTPTVSRASSGGGYEHFDRLSRTCGPDQDVLRDLILWAFLTEIE